MKKFNANVVFVRNVEFSVLANSKKEALEKVKNILDTTDIIKNTEGEASTLFKVFDDDDEDEDMCDGDCENCPYDAEDEGLWDEMY